MTGKLYVIGIGPGDPELLTLKAVRILKQTSCLFVPKGREEGESLALAIVSRIIDLYDKEVITAYFPMRKTRGGAGASDQEEGAGREDLEARWTETAGAISKRLSQGRDVAFLTLGDPGIYSTFYYLYPRLLDLNPRLNLEIIPGVSAVNAAAARAAIPLGLADEKIAILPANYHHKLEDTLKDFDTVILMKVQRRLEAIREILRRRDLRHRAVYISRLGMEGEKITTDIETLNEDEGEYFSLLIIKPEGRGR